VALVTIAIQLQCSRVETPNEPTSANIKKRVNGLTEDVDDTLSTGFLQEPNLNARINTAVGEDLNDTPVMNVPTINVHVHTDNTAVLNVCDLKRSLQQANEKLAFLSEHAKSLEAEREELKKRLWIYYDEGVYKVKQGMIQEAANRAAAQRINDKLKGDDREWCCLFSVSPVLTAEIDLLSRCDAVIARHAALMGRLVSEARALSELQNSLHIGEITMYEIRAMTRMSLGRLQSLVAEATDVASN
jgi:hypothetical protein